MDKICTTLDKLTLDTLTLMEEYIKQKIKLEDTMNEGILNLAKSRYILGHNNVSGLQLPSVDSQDISAATVAHSEENEKLGYKMYDFDVMKDKSKEKGHDPLKWFGVLVPQNLHIAQNKFKQALIWVCEVLNMQVRLNHYCTKLDQLQRLKETM